MIVIQLSGMHEHSTSNVDNDVYLGHVSDSHYISLRPKNWQQNLITCKYKH